ncbi:MAG: 5-formyltetrahydrofolate cyclo-ligase [Gammaproteobacteria bacterium]|nr:5-formyltetrahydrofolate cyclo-ligase [Gammaproteobacteria bacterium]
MNGDTPDKAHLRRTIRARRLAVQADQAAAAAAAVARRLWALPLLARSRTLALYLPVRGELDCTPIIIGAWRRRRRVFLPVVGRDSLRFAPFAPHTRLAPNRFGIPEPVARSAGVTRDARHLDVVILPLVAFDERGYRLGYGGGFYDRTLAHLARNAGFARPHVVGVAYEFQRVEALPNEKWDIPLDAIVSESASRICR